MKLIATVASDRMYHKLDILYSYVQLKPVNILKRNNFTTDIFQTVTHQAIYVAQYKVHRWWRLDAVADYNVIFHSKKTTNWTRCLNISECE